MGVVLRWQDENNFDKAYLDGSDLVIMEKSGGQTRELGHTTFAATSGTSYTLRLAVEQGRLVAKAWVAGQAQPQVWMLSGKGTLISGQAGVRALLLQDDEVQVTACRAVMD